MCDKRVKTDKRTQSSEQEVCEVFMSQEERKKESKSKAEGVRGRRVKRKLKKREREEEVEKDVMDWTGVT